jgi:hypothetical protein
MASIFAKYGLQVTSTSLGSTNTVSSSTGPPASGMWTSRGSGCMVQCAQFSYPATEQYVKLNSMLVNSMLNY